MSSASSWPYFWARPGQTAPPPAIAGRGNNGSPIFLCSTGKFAGIVYAQAADTISIIDDSKQKVVRMSYGASLAACIPASAIRKFLEAR
jgi:hypothetical protein